MKLCCFKVCIMISALGNIQKFRDMIDSRALIIHNFTVDGITHVDCFAHMHTIIDYIFKYKLMPL